MSFLQINSKFHPLQFICLVLLAALSGVGQTADQHEVTELKPNQMLEREIKNKETHVYKFDLKSGEFFQVRVEHKEINVILNLLGENKKVLATMDSPNYSTGAETLSYIAAKDENLKLEVSGSAEEIEGEISKGHYSIKRIFPRAPTATDKRRVEIERYFIEGLKASNNKGQEKKALAKLEESLFGWQELNEKNLFYLTDQRVRKLNPAYEAYENAIWSIKIGETMDPELRDFYCESLNNFQEASRLYLKIGDKPGAGASLYAAGLVSEQLPVCREDPKELLKKASEYIGEKTNREVNLLKLKLAKRFEALAFDLVRKSSFYQAGLLFLGASRLYLEIGDKNNAGFSIYAAGLTSELRRKHTDAQKLFKEATNYIGQNIQINREFYDINSEGFESLARINNFFGRTYIYQGDVKKAIEIYGRFLKLEPDLSSNETNLNVLNLGLAHFYFYQQDEAIRYFSQVKNKSENEDLRFIAINNLGETYRHKGEYLKAIDEYQELKPDEVYKPGVFGIRNREKLYISESTDLLLGEATDSFLMVINPPYSPGRGVASIRPTEKQFRDDIQIVINNLGLAFFSVGDYAQALNHYQKAKLINKELRSGAIISNNLALIYKTLGQNDKALSMYRDSLENIIELKDEWGEALILNNIGGLHLSQGRLETALLNFEKSLKLMRKVKEKKGEANVLNNLGGLYLLKRENTKATDHFKKALQLRRETGDFSGEADTLSNLGSMYFEGKKYQDAEKYYLQSLAIRRKTKNKAGEAIAYHNLMVVSQVMVKTYLAIFYGKQSVNKYQEIRQNIQTLDKETQRTYLNKLKITYRVLADLLIEKGLFVQAEKVLAMLKEEEYFEFIRRDAGEIGNLNERILLNEKESALIKRYSQFADKVVEIGQEFLKLDDKKRQLSRSDLTLSAEEQNRYAELEKQLDTANAAFRLFMENELVGELGKQKKKEIEYDRKLQAKLRKWGEGTVALYTVTGEERYRVILTTSKVQVDGKTEIKMADLNKKIFAFRNALQDPNIDPRPLGKELYDILIKPIEKQLTAAQAKTLIWSLDGTLRYLPLAALSPDGKKYLVEDFQNVIITPKTRDDVSNSNSDWRVLGLGVKVFQTVANPDDESKKLSFGELPGSERELLAIVSDDRNQNEKGVLSGRRFMDKDFSSINFKDSLAKETAEGKREYNVVHIASHFRLGSNWSNSFLLLGDGQILTLEEINDSSSIDFGDVELVTLSACNTGFADNSNGKEIDSLASVIQTKSGKAVLATLWPVADVSTSLLMSEFYRLRKEKPQLTKARAIQLAQQEMINGKLKSATEGNKKGTEFFSIGGQNLNLPKFEKNKDKPFAHPYYWSPFVLIGNWR